MRNVAILGSAFALGVFAAACGGHHGTRAPHLPPPQPSTATTSTTR